VIHIGVGFGRLRSLHDGLAEFSLQLGRQFALAAPALREQHGVQLHYHLPERLHGHFGPEVQYLAQRSGQKWWHRQPQRFDVWHTLNQHAKFAAPQGTRRRLMTVHDFNYLYDRGNRRRREQHLINRLLLWRTDLAVTISDYVARDLQQHFGFRKPIVRIYNGARNSCGEAQEAVPGLVPGQYLFHLSRMAATKNPRALLNLAAVWPEQAFLLAGPASFDSETLRAEITQRGLHNVSILNDVSDAQKAWLFAHCKGFLLPSLTEGFGLPLIEAMHHGVPVFASDRTCLPEIGGDCVFYWPSFEPAAMKQVVQDGLAAAQQPGFAQRLKARAASFNWPDCAQQYLQLYLQQAGVAGALAHAG
jgi:glycosyltransferase involved in cell wall biosynthesis